jgi:3-phenylpropionate/trans-cinnamate dioxygenase ferredoxin subunit
MKEKKYVWHKIADSIKEIKFSANGLSELKVANKIVCVALREDRLHAFTQKCPHAGGFMVNGYIDALGNIVCPLHRYKFSLQNGRNTSGEGYFLKIFPIEIRQEGVFIGFEEVKFFNC